MLMEVAKKGKKRKTIPPNSIINFILALTLINQMI